MANNRRKGHQFERSIAERWRQLGYEDAMTSRAGDRSKDEEGIDILHTYPFNIQCKSHKIFKSPVQVFKQMPDGTSWNVIYQKVKNQGEYAIMKAEDYEEIVAILKANGII